MAIDERQNLSLADFPNLRSTGSRWRAGCPVHGSDHQRSVRIHPETGHWKCHVADCGAWGYIAEMRQPDPVLKLKRKVQPPPKPPRPEVSAERRDELARALERAQADFPGSPAEVYLAERGIPPDLAQQYGAGFAPWDRWDRVIFPLHDPDGIVALYGRAIGDAPKSERHRITDGAKGYFNLPNVIDAPEVIVTEGVFDALSVIAAGNAAAVAIIGADDLRPDWLRRQKGLTFALDNDEAGKGAMGKAAPIARSWGFCVALADLAAYGEHKDLNAYWVTHGRLPWQVDVIADDVPAAPAPIVSEPDEPNDDHWDTGGPVEEVLDAEEQIAHDLFDPPAWQPKVLTFHKTTLGERYERAGTVGTRPAKDFDVPAQPGDPHAEALELQSLWNELGRPTCYGPNGWAITDLVTWMRHNGPEKWEAIRWSLSVWNAQRDKLKDARGLAG